MEVVTQDLLNEQLKELAKNTFEILANGADINFANVILMAMRVVEEYSAHKKLNGGDKFKAAQALIPTIVELAVQSGKISEEDGVELRARLEAGSQVIGNVINAYVLLSKNPQFIQLQQEIEEEVTKCIASCKTRCKK